MHFWLYFQFWRSSAKLNLDLPALGVHLLLRRITSGLDTPELLPALPATGSTSCQLYQLPLEVAARELAARELAARELAARGLAARELVGVLGVEPGGNTS